MDECLKSPKMALICFFRSYDKNYRGGKSPPPLVRIGLIHIISWKFENLSDFLVVGDAANASKIARELVDASGLAAKMYLDSSEQT